MLRILEWVTVASQHGVFWDDLAGDLEDPEFARQYAIESARVTTIDAVVNSLDEARVASGMSKAELARAIGSEPATIRRLFTQGQVNPTLGTVAEVAAALGFEIVVKPVTSQQGRRRTLARRTTEPASAVRRPSPRATGVAAVPVVAKADPTRSAQAGSR